MEPTTGSQMTSTSVQEAKMQRVVSEITSSRARADPSSCISDLNPLLNTAEGRLFLSKQQGENASVLIDLFDWALGSHKIPANKGCVLWTLRQLCACLETLPKSYLLEIDFKPTDPHHAAGGFADVWRGAHNGSDVALKSIRGSIQADEAVRLKRKRRFCKEVILWKSLNHPNILGLIGVCPWDGSPDARLTMVSEWMTNGNITEYIKGNDSQRMQLLIDCAKGVRYLHGANLVHGDLKGANILITSHNPVRACLADFGFMTIVYEIDDEVERTSAIGGGTTPFMAPELLSPGMFRKTRCQVSKEADVYAFGMVVLQVLTGLTPFHPLRDTEIAFKVLQGHRPTKPINASDVGISEGLWSFLARCWNINDAKRPRVNEIYEQLCKEPARGWNFPPSKFVRAPSRESILVSGTHHHDEIFRSAVSEIVQTPTEECPPFPMPMSPTVGEGSDDETTNPDSMFPIPRGIGSVTSLGNSHLGDEEPKPSVSEASSRTISNGSDSAGDEPDFGRTPFIRGPGHFQNVSYENQHCPSIRDTQSQHVDPTETPAPDRRIIYPSSALSDSPGGRPRLPRIETNPPPEPRNSGDSRTQYFTPVTSGGVRDSRTFNSALGIQVVYSGSSAGSRDVTDHARRVVDVRQPGAERVKSKHQFSIRPLELPRRKGSSRRPNINPSSETINDEPRHGLKIPLAPPSRNTQRFPNFQGSDHQRDSSFSFSSSPFDEFQSGAGPSRGIPEAGTSTIPIPRHEPGSRQPRSKLPSQDEGNDPGGGREATFPRPGVKRAVPGWGGAEDTDEGKRKEKGKERGDRSHPPAPPLSNEAEDPTWEQNLTPRPNPSFVKSLLTKLGVRESSRILRSSLPPKRAPSRGKNAPSSIPELKKRDVKLSIVSMLGGHKGRAN